MSKSAAKKAPVTKTNTTGGLTEKDTARSVRKKDSAAQTGARPKNPMPKQHQPPPGIEADVELFYKFKKFLRVAASLCLRVSVSVWILHILSQALLPFPEKI